jgi:hypothetical protein
MPHTGAVPDHPPHDPTLAATTEARYSSSHRAIGLSLRVDTNDERVQRAALESFGPGLERIERPDALIQIFTHHIVEAPDWRPCQPVVRRFGQYATIVASRASAMTIDISTGTSMGFISDQAASQAEFVRSSFVQSAFLQVAHEQALVAIHTACLWRAGRSILVRGLSGAGKSTLCYAALRSGWSLVAEDVVFIRTRPGADLTRLRHNDIEAHGLPYILHLLPDARALFPELAGEPVVERPDGDFKICVHVEQRFPGQARPSAPIGPLYFVTRGTAGSPSLRNVTRTEALTLLRESVIMDEAVIAERTGLWDAFLEQPAYVLETGDDPDESASLLE